jgi:hypothetical protein
MADRIMFLASQNKSRDNADVVYRVLGHEILIRMAIVRHRQKRHESSPRRLAALYLVNPSQER